MNILVSCMGYDSGKSGISSYMTNVVREFKNTPYHYTLILENDSVNDFSPMEMETIVAPKLFSKSLMGMIWHMLILPFYTLKKKYDVIIILAASRRYLAFSRIPQIGIIHDLSPYRIKGKYDPLRMFYLKKLQPWLGRQLDSIVAISQSTRDDIARYWHIPVDKITLNYNGSNTLPPPDTHILQKFNLRQYILYVSRLEHPGKNHIGLFKAYETLPPDLQQKYQLVIAGAEWKGFEPIKEYASKSRQRKRIIFTGFVSAAELAALYKNASIFVFPSFSEGFGLPLLEAMNFEIPCACSNCTSMIEIAADAALLFDPSSPAEIQSCIQQILSHPSLAQELVRRGNKQKTLFSWKKHVDTLLRLALSYQKG